MGVGGIPADAPGEANNFSSTQLQEWTWMEMVAYIKEQEPTRSKGFLALLLGTRTLLGAPGLTTRNKDATSNKRNKGSTLPGPFPLQVGKGRHI